MHGCIELQIICIACSFWRKHVIWWLSYILPIIYSFLYLRVRSLQFSNEKPDIGNVSNTVMCLQYCDVLAKCNLQYCPILSTTVQYCSILSNTVQYWPILAKCNLHRRRPNNTLGFNLPPQLNTILQNTIEQHNTIVHNTQSNPVGTIQFTAAHKRTMRND